MTSGTTLSDCFQGNNFLEESRKWMKTLKSMLYKCFPVVRTTNKINFQQSIILEQMSIKSKLQIAIKNMSHSNTPFNGKIYNIVILKKKIESIDLLISLLTSERHARIIKENFSDLTEEGIFHLPKMWSLKKKINNHHKSDVPTAKRDPSGNLVTNQRALKSSYKNEYISRLSRKSGLNELNEYFMLQETLFQIRYELALKSKSTDFQTQEVLKVCKNLKTKKQETII